MGRRWSEVRRRLSSWWTSWAGQPPSTVALPHAPKTAPGVSPATMPDAATAPALPMRATDGKRSVWLWTQDGKVHASLTPTARATERGLTPSDVAHLLLADPPRTMPAIHTVTGMADPDEAVAQLRAWRPRTAVRLDAADLAGRHIPGAQQKPTRSNIDGTVRTVSGGLPSLNKRRR